MSHVMPAGHLLLRAAEPVLSGRLDVWTPPIRTSYLRRATDDLPFPSGDSTHRLFVRARHALFAGVLALGLEPGDQVLVPAYHHGSEIEALRRAGIRCAFYGATADLEPDPQELSDLVGPRCRALYLIHVLGFPQDARRWRRWCDERNLLLIEDAAHAWSARVDGRRVGSLGDLSIFCLGNTLPLPDLSAAVVRGVGHADMMIPGRHGAVKDVVGPFSVEQEFALGDPTSRPGRLAPFLFSRLAGEDPGRARRENYRLLLERLSDLVPAPFDRLPDGASPMAFPVETPDKPALLHRLAARGVGGIDFWATPHPSAPPGAAETAAHRRRRTVALPVHQRLSADDLDQIAEAVRPVPGPPEKFSIERVDGLEALRDEWTVLAARTNNVFATWEWQHTWWEHFGKGRPLEVTALRDSRGALRAVLPLYLSTERPVRIARFLGGGAGDQLGPICAPGDEPAVSRSLRGLLRSGEWDLILGEQMPSAAAWGKRLTGRTLRQEGSPVVQLGGSWEETMSSWSRGLRKELRRDERRLRADHDVQVQTVTEHEDLETSLKALFRLHRARWPERTGFEKFEPFHRDFARRAFDNGWLRLRIMEADGRPVAARLGFRFHGVESGYQSGWDPAYADYSIGILLVADTIRAAQADGMRTYTFLRGGEAYKYRFATADPGLETVLFARPGVSGLAAAGAAMAGTPIPGYLRSMLGRLA